MMWLSTTAFAKKADMLLIGTFVAFYCIPALARIAPPSHMVFNVKEGNNVRDLASLINFQPIDVCPEARLAPLVKETAGNTRARRKRVHQKKQDVVKTPFISMLEGQWPCERPTRPRSGEVDIYIKVEATMANIVAKWRLWWQNLQFHNYLSNIESELRLQSYRVLDTSLNDFPRGEIADRNRKRHVRNQDVFIYRLRRSLTAS
jgi:hypothetical protein